METVQRRKTARKEFEEAVKIHSETLVIHYSHALCYGEEDDISFPMITAIAVKSLNGSIYEYFGIHIEADLINCSKQEIKDYYPELELSMLEKFNDFVKRHSQCYWIHWDMININYGFQAIQHRYAKLAGERKEREFKVIPSNKKINLNSILSDMYGDNYASSSDKLLNLLTYNNYPKVKYLSLVSEETEFYHYNFQALLDSLDIKVTTIAQLSKKIISKKIKIPKKNNYSIFIDIITHPLFHLIGWIATILGVAITYK